MILPMFDPVSHTYTDSRGKNLPSVTWILSNGGLCDFSFVKREARLNAMMRGKNVHWTLQLDDEGVLNYRTVPAWLRPFRKAYRAWKTASGFVPHHIEHMVVSPHGYAGMLDRTGSFPPTALFPLGSVAIVDLKTGDGKVQEWVKYQLAAYLMALHVQVAQCRRYRRIGVALHSNGLYSVREFPVATLSHDFATFMEKKRKIDEDSSERQAAIDSIYRAVDQTGSIDSDRASDSDPDF